MLARRGITRRNDYIFTKERKNIVMVNFENYPDLLTTDQTRKILQVGKSKMYELIDNKEIKYIKVGRNYRFLKKYITDFLEINSSDFVGNRQNNLKGGIA